MALGVPAGPKVGQILATMTAWWVDHAFAPSREEALASLNEVVALAGRGGDTEKQ
jgi:hypothetical protein